MIETKSNIVNVPAQFRFQDPLCYPEDNTVDFEYWLSLNIKSEDIPDGHCYLPITWTAFYKRANYGKEVYHLNELQKFLNNLPANVQYATTIQWDDGCLNDLSHLDIKVFSMSGQPMDYPLPLICQPHNFNSKSQDRNFTACFIGANTHPVRSQLYKLSKISEFFISASKVGLDGFCHILSKSVFSLCPRGYGISSFRIMESLQYGAIPVYISDFFLEPHIINFDYYGIKVHLEDIYRLPEILASVDNEQIEYLRKNGKYIYDNFYTFEANKKLILKNLQ